MEQVGEWYTVDGGTDTSPNTTTTDTTTTTTTTTNDYCLLQPNITCHYRDKPSIIPCTTSPPIVKVSCRVDRSFFYECIWHGVDSFKCSFLAEWIYSTQNMFECVVIPMLYHYNRQRYLITGLRQKITT